ncbi:MAG: ATP-binding cassette domain-containing protein [Methanobacteriaceae archaeon]|uniref:ATP-binding protein n=2 Tax=Methanothermobacter tenebrarum TaxID=680118 RepID=A0A328PC82_9EURY|nr:ATP-binding cassette domain-containing protein [Methanobacteriaceae archaeon]RAO79360.1 ATP-binding protein [Methanothermobacter tenebrarum]
MMVIEVKGLSKKFGDIQAVDNISFNVKEGEIFGFLGPNGAGKTTTVRMLTGIIKPDNGQINILGHDMIKDPIKVKEKIGVVPETSNAYIDITGWENMMLTAGLYDMPKEKATRRSKELLEDFDIYNRRNYKVKGYSKGMKQRLILCMALLHNPLILFLDEPTSGLDVQSSIKIIEKLKKIKEEGKTIFLTTHNMWEAEKLCDRIAIINKGKIAAIDKPRFLKEITEEMKEIEVIFEEKPDLEKLKKFVSIIRRKDKSFIIESEDMTDTIWKIGKFAMENNLQIKSLNTLTPSLEEVFIKIIEGK